MRLSLHVLVSAVSDGEDVRRELADFAVLVFLHVRSIVNRVNLIGIDGHQNGASVSLEQERKNIILPLPCCSGLGQISWLVRSPKSNE